MDHYIYAYIRKYIHIHYAIIPKKIIPASRMASPTGIPAAASSAATRNPEHLLSGREKRKKVHPKVRYAS